MKLNAGCGKRPTPGFINVDLDLDSKADVICSLEALPFQDSIFSEIVCNHVLEHLTEDMWRGRTGVSSALLEFSRVLTEDGLVRIEVPSPQGIHAVRTDHATVYDSRTLRWLYGLYFSHVQCKGVGTWVQMRVLHRLFKILSERFDPFFGDAYGFTLRGPKKQNKQVIKY